ncbi:MAG: YjbQ family protein [Nanoarchaeota archaeon]|nr:YjbQ family protein [Nanoarchaeota archaeon]
MKHFLKRVEIKTREPTRIYDITTSIERLVEESKFSDGHVLVQPMHTTTGVYCNEFEDFLIEDLIRHLNDQAPQIQGKYRHDNIAERDCPPDEPKNGHSHIKAALYSNHSVSLILYERSLQIGQYQRILFAEFDGPCPRRHKGTREYLVSILGE